MTLAGWLAALSLGLLAGVLSGLVGIGGGAVMVPFLYFFIAHPELSGAYVLPHEQAVVAHATSLLVIVPISLRGAWLYSRAGLVEWSAVWRMGLASIPAAILGARIAVLVPGGLLKLSFGIFLVVVATQLVFGKRRTDVDLTDIWSIGHTGRALIGGVAVGLFSALLGVGGGLVAIPVLMYWLHVPLRKVSGTSLALITFTALTGVITYVVSGALRTPGGPFSYFHLPAAAALAVGALVAVPLGARAQMRLPTHTLRWLFAALFFLLGLRIVVTNLISLLGR